MQHACQFQLQRAPLLPATHGELAFCTTLLSRHSLPGVKLASLFLFLEPLVGTLPSARHCSHVTPFLKANLLFFSVRNCDRGKLRSHALHVIGTAAALMEISALLAK